MRPHLLRWQYLYKGFKMETIGEAFMRPYTEEQRAQTSQQRMLNQNNNALSRLNLSKMRLNLSKSRLAQMQRLNNIRMQQLSEKAREFNETLDFKNRQLNVAQQNGLGSGRYATAEQKNVGAAMQIAQDAGAITADGKVDLSKMTPIQRWQFSKLSGASDKGSTTAYNLNQIPKATNLLTTMNSVDISPAEYYSGTEGRARLLKDKAMAAAGKPSKEYTDYQTLTQTQLPAMVDQLTKYWGSSISPGAVSEMNNMILPANQVSNPNSPEIVVQSYKDLSKLISSEALNSLAAVQDASFYNPDSVTGGGNFTRPTASPAGSSYGDNGGYDSSSIPQAANVNQHSAGDHDVLKAALTSGVPIEKIVTILNGK
jgi:hypothetical protein